MELIDVFRGLILSVILYLPLLIACGLPFVLMRLLFKFIYKTKPQRVITYLMIILSLIIGSSMVYIYFTFFFTMDMDRFVS